MSNVWRPTAADRDEQGFIRVDTPEPTAAAALYEETRQAIAGDPVAAPTEPTAARPRPDRGPTAAPARPLLTADAIRALVAIALLIIGAAIWTLLTSRGGDAAPARPLAPPTATMAPATFTPTPQWITAFAAPGGVALGPVDIAAIRYKIIGRLGERWIQIDAGGNIGNVWLRRIDVPLDNDDLAALAAAPDLATPTPAPTDLPPPPPPPDTPVPAVVLPPEPTVCAESFAGKGCGANSATAEANLRIIETHSAQNLATSAVILDVTRTALAVEQATATAASRHP